MCPSSPPLPPPPPSPTLRRPSAAALQGYNFESADKSHNRLTDRDTIMRDMCKESDQEVYNLLRYWGVKYVLGEYKRCGRDVTIDGRLTKQFERGRYSVWRVEGY